MRKLVTIKPITAIDSIPDADMIVKVTIDSAWTLVSQKSNNFQVGDNVVYVEIDSMLPIDNPAFEFLANRGVHTVDGRSYHRLKSIRLKKTLSQGLILPIDVVLTDDQVKEYRDYEDYISGMKEAELDLSDFDERDVLADLLGIIKYEPVIPGCLQGRIRGNFPMFIPKTDEERIQNCWRDVKRYYPEDTYEVTEKLDGSSMTVYLNDGVFGVCSRNLDLLEEEGNAFWSTARKYGFEEKLREYGKNIAIQSELIGPGVQGNIYSLKELEMRVFNIYDIDNKKYLDAQARANIVKNFDIPSVPVLGHFKFNFETVDDFLSHVEGTSALSPKGQQVTREGLVYKSLENPHWSFKGISNKFLLRHDS